MGQDVTGRDGLGRDRWLSFIWRVIRQLSFAQIWHWPNRVQESDCI